VSAYESFLLRIIDKTNSTPTGITDNGLIDGDISPFLVRCELLHSIVNRTSNLTIVVYIPENGIFSTAVPKLLDSDAQDKYYMEAQLEQPAGTFGKLFRMRIGQPTLIQEDAIGDVVKIPIVGIEYITREYPTSKQDKLISPKQRFINIFTEINGDTSSEKPVLNVNPADVDLSDGDVF